MFEKNKIYNKLKTFSDSVKAKVLSNDTVPWIALLICGAVIVMLMGLALAISFEISRPYAISAIVIVALVILFSVLYNRRLNKFPNLKWKFIILEKEEELFFKTREKIEVTSRIKYKPLENDVNEVDSGFYKWSGSKSSIMLLDDSLFELISDEHAPNYFDYILRPKENLQKYKEYECNMFFDLDDERHEMKPYFCINISRPTRKLKITVIVPKEVSITNVESIHKNKYSDKVTIDGKNKIIKASTGGHSSGLTAYTYDIQSPTLFTKYIIKWKFNDNASS